jgi:hypothetical protein
MAKGNPWERKAILKELREKHGFSEEDADSIGRARNETTRLVLDKLNAVGASPEQQQEDLDTYLDAHVKRITYEQGLENEPNTQRNLKSLFGFYLIGAVIISIGVLSIYGGDLLKGIIPTVAGAVLVLLIARLQYLEKRRSYDYADLLMLCKRDYEEAQAKLDKLLTRIGGPVDELSAEDEAIVNQFLDDNF